MNEISQQVMDVSRLQSFDSAALRPCQSAHFPPPENDSMEAASRQRIHTGSASTSLQVDQGLRGKAGA
jgi:hypothetical protein